jgi:hypothetical protein
MFERANLGEVTWPTEVPDLGQPATSAGYAKATVPVRYRILRRAELAEIDQQRTSALLATLRANAEKGETPIEAVSQAQSMLESVEQGLQRGKDEDAKRRQRLLDRVLGFVDGDGKVQPFELEQLAQLLDFEPYFDAFEDGLFAASRGAVAKN